MVYGCFSANAALHVMKLHHFLVPTLAQRRGMGGHRELLVYALRCKFLIVVAVCKSPEAEIQTPGPMPINEVGNGSQAGDFRLRPLPKHPLENSVDVFGVVGEVEHFFEFGGGDF